MLTAAVNYIKRLNFFTHTPEFILPEIIKSFLFPFDFFQQYIKTRKIKFDCIGINGLLDTLILKKWLVEIYRIKKRRKKRERGERERQTEGKTFTIFSMSKDYTTTMHNYNVYITLSTCFLMNVQDNYRLSWSI